MKKIIASILCLALSFAVFCQDSYLLVGTYTSPKSDGVYVYKFNSTTGDFSYVSKGVAANPSFLAVSPNKKYVYAVNEDGNDKGSISAFSFDKDKGTLQALNKQSSGGDHPCFVTTDKTGKWVIVGNYTGGSLSVLPVNTDGSLKPAAQTIQHTGSSINKERQEKAHVHSTFFSPDYQYVFVPDLGMDKVMTYSFNVADGKLTAAPVPFTPVTPGAGPRHLAFHPNGKYVYLIEEMAGAIVAYKYEKGRLQLIQSISALPENYTGKIGSADIHVSPDGKFVYASNRDDANSIVICKVDQQTGKLTVVGHQSTMGKTPRNFNFDPSGNFLLVANQNSDDIVIFKRDKQTGLLTDTGKRIEVGKPVCIKWVSK